LFVERLRELVTSRIALWEETIINGSRGFRFSLGQETSARIWDLQLQPQLGIRQGVSISCQPDFLLTTDHSSIPPIAIFTDGFQPHCQPGSPESRLPDDIQKRRAILASNNYLVWSLTWGDLQPGGDVPELVPETVLAGLRQARSQALARRVKWPEVGLANGNSFEQLVAFLDLPERTSWTQFADLGLYLRIAGVANNNPNGLSSQEIAKSERDWIATGNFIAPLSDTGDHLLDLLHPRSNDVLAGILRGDLANRAFQKTRVRARLPEDEMIRATTDFKARWQRFLRVLNLFQFASDFEFWVASEYQETMPMAETGREPLTDAWRQVFEFVVVSVRVWVESWARAGLPIPNVEFYLIDSDACAELAWLEQRCVLLVGDQESFASVWEAAGWRVFTLDILSDLGTDLFN
jgi:DEAD/DEAH box helicase domain-containing protein